MTTKFRTLFGILLVVSFITTACAQQVTATPSAETSVELIYTLGSWDQLEEEYGAYTISSGNKLVILFIEEPPVDSAGSEKCFQDEGGIVYEGEAWLPSLNGMSIPLRTSGGWKYRFIAVVDTSDWPVEAHFDGDYKILLPGDIVWKLCPERWDGWEVGD